MFDGEAFGAEIVGHVRDYVDRATAPLMAEIADLRRQLAAIPAGPAGKDADPAIIRAMVGEAVAALPPPKDGVGVAGAMIDRSGVLILTLSDGGLSTLGVVVGKDGVDGRPGERGEKGDPGERGPAGEMGLAGQDGAVGERGEKGDTGERGPAGEMGLAGQDGVVGDRGEKGDPGERGPAGEAGQDGAAGERGEKGEPGERGPVGEAGLAGAQGDVGDRGEKGDAGERGLAGGMGLAGQDGAPGERGEKGDIGERGFVGETGLAGARGDAGERGEKGDVGERGPTGEAGLAGKDGAPGDRGAAGEKGDPGADGVGLADALIDRDNNLVITMADGRAKSLGLVVGRDADPDHVERLVEAAVAAIPRPRDGQDGRDGFGLDDFKAALHEDGRTISLSFVRDGQTLAAHDLTMPALVWRGVHDIAASYAKGDLVTWGGSMWHCNAPTMEKPGEASKVWTLCVKRGRDGRDAAL